MGHSATLHIPCLVNLSIVLQLGANPFVTRAKAMAEAVGVVASGLGIAAFAQQIVSSAMKIQQLWSAIQHAPESVAIRVEEITAITTLISEVSDQYRQGPTSGSPRSTAFDMCLTFFKSSAKSLEDLVADLDKLMSTKRKRAAVKVVLKRETLAECKAKLESAKSMLILAQQSYQTLVPQLNVMQWSS
jgi:hypothetical protein